MLALKEAVRRESGIEIVLEEIPANGHQANRLIENTSKTAQGQLRVLKDALESSIGRRITGEQPIVPWLVMHAASAINRGRITKDLPHSEDGKAASSTSP